MPEVETEERDVEPGKEQDIIVKTGRFRFYFQNYYTLISLFNDLFTGGLFLVGSVLGAFTDYQDISLYTYVFGSFFLLMRPIIKITHNVFFYDAEEYKEQILGDETKEAEEKAEEGDPDKQTKEVEIKSKSDDEDNESEKTDEKENGHSSEQNEDENDGREQIDMDYNEEYYGEQGKNE